MNLDVEQTRKLYIYDDNIMKKGNIYLPVVSLDLVNRFSGRKRAIIADMGSCMYDDFEYHLKPLKKIELFILIKNVLILQ